MPWNVNPLKNGFAAELCGKQLNASLSNADRRSLYDATVLYGVVVVRNQGGLSDAEIHDLAVSLPGEIVPLKLPFGEGPVVPGVVQLSNLSNDGSVLPPDAPSVRQNQANELWHSDLTFQTPRASLSMLYALQVPASGGDTEFCDTRFLWDDLAESERERLKNLSCLHSGAYSRRKYGLPGWEKDAPGYEPVKRPMTLKHPDTGRIAVTIGSYVQLVGQLDECQSQILLDDLVQRATVPDRVYKHQWRSGDMLIWDNRSMIHRARPFPSGSPRDLRAVRLFDPLHP